MARRANQTRASQNRRAEIGRFGKDDCRPPGFMVSAKQIAVRFAMRRKIIVTRQNLVAPDPKVAMPSREEFLRLRWLHFGAIDLPEPAQASELRFGTWRGKHLPGGGKKNHFFLSPPLRCPHAL